MQKKKKRQQILSASLGNCEARSSGHLRCSQQEMKLSRVEIACLCFRDAAECRSVRELHTVS